MHHEAPGCFRMSQVISGSPRRLQEVLGGRTSPQDGGPRMRSVMLKLTRTQIDS